MCYCAITVFIWELENHLRLLKKTFWCYRHILSAKKFANSNRIKSFSSHCSIKKKRKKIGPCFQIQWYWIISKWAVLLAGPLMVPDTRRIGFCHTGSASRDVICQAGVSFGAAQAVFQSNGIFSLSERSHGGGWHRVAVYFTSDWKQAGWFSQCNKTTSSLHALLLSSLLPSLTQLPFFSVSSHLVWVFYPSWWLLAEAKVMWWVIIKADSLHGFISYFSVGINMQMFTV